MSYDNDELIGGREGFTSMMDDEEMFPTDMDLDPIEPLGDNPSEYEEEDPEDNFH